jgi:molybdopterin-guanine dinucleotide biosynthesis protein A
VAPGGLTGILLVGGESRRFGSAKALASLDGETLAARAWRILGEACDERVAVGKESDILDLPFALVDDGTDVRAALAGIVAGLRSAPTDSTVVLPVDTPLVGPAELRTLAAARAADAAVPQTGPLPCALHRRVLPVLERRLESGDLALRRAFAELDVCTVELDPAVLVNVNTPSDLAALELRIVPIGDDHVRGFRSLVADTLAEFGFTPDPELDADLADPRAHYAAIWVVVRGGEVVGSIALRDLGDGVLELKRMYLRKTCRGRRTGSRLLGTALDWARASGARLVKLDTTEEMAAARRLYESRGFVRVPGHAPRQGQERLLYELRL